MASENTDLDVLRDLTAGFRSSRILLTANNFRVFDLFKEKGRTSREAAKALGTDERATSILLDALTGLGLLRKKSGRYQNSSISKKYLVSGSRFYQGDILRHNENLWKNWSALDDVLKTGKPARHSFDHDAFIRGMHNISIPKVKTVLDSINLEGVETALDLGGGPGTYCHELTRRGVRCTLFDRPETLGIARELAGEKLAAKMEFKGGDFTTDDIGKGYDLILISQIFHAYSGAENVKLMRKCSKALNPGGKVLIQEFPISDDMTKPAEGAIFAVNMLVATESGRCYSVREMKSWLKSTGFAKPVAHTIMGSVVLLAEKPARKSRRSTVASKVPSRPRSPEGA